VMCWLNPIPQAVTGSLLTLGLSVSGDCEMLDLGSRIENPESAFPPSASATLSIDEQGMTGPVNFPARRLECLPESPQPPGSQLEGRGQISSE
jgi:hypothetical protein